MKYLKVIFKTVAIIGALLAIGTAGASDMQIETGQLLMTDAQMFFHIGISVLLFLTGTVGNKVCNCYNLSKAKKFVKPYKLNEVYKKIVEM